MRVEPWAYRVEAADASGQMNHLWLRQDGLGKWLVTEHFQMFPERYLRADGRWSHLATPDTRHSEHAARSLALDLVMNPPQP